MVKHLIQRILNIFSDITVKYWIRNGIRFLKIQLINVKDSVGELYNLNSSEILIIFSVANDDTVHHSRKEIPKFVGNTVLCLALQIFLNCKNYAADDECSLTRQMIQTTDKCGEKVNGTMIIQYTYWRIAYDAETSN